MGSTVFPEVATEPALPSQSGNSGKFLTTDGSSKSWGAVTAGGMTLISTTSLSGSSTVTLSSIPQTYTNLLLVVQGFAGMSTVALRSNGTTGSNYYNQTYGVGTEFFITNNLNYPTNSEGLKNSLACTIYNYTNTTSSKVCFTVGTALTASTSTYNGYSQVGQNFGTGTTAISSISILGTTFSQGTAYLYGVK